MYNCISVSRKVRNTFFYIFVDLIFVCMYCNGNEEKGERALCFLTFSCLFFCTNYENIRESCMALNI